MGDGSANLPPGLHFCPTDEELVLHFLYCKASLLPYNPDIIPDFGCRIHDPWELQGKAFSGGDKYYFFSQVTGNRVTENGLWKDEETEEPVFTSDGKKVGIKKYLVFYIGEPPSGIKTNWIMHEYHLCSCDAPNMMYRRTGYRKLDSSRWVLCQVYEKSSDSQSNFSYSDEDGSELLYLDEVFFSLEGDLDEISFLSQY